MKLLGLIMILFLLTGCSSPSAEKDLVPYGDDTFSIRHPREWNLESDSLGRITLDGQSGESVTI